MHFSSFNNNIPTHFLMTADAFTAIEEKEEGGGGGCLKYLYHTVPTRGKMKPAPTLARTSLIGKVNPVLKNNN